MSATESTKVRYLTKSRFQLGMQCPTKLFYTAKQKEYANQSLEDAFLESLAEGGFQVGELAKQYLSGGEEIETLDYEEALNRTNSLLTQKNVTIYEAAIAFKNLFIRADILIKQGNNLDLIEVKAKSYDPDADGDFIGKRGGVAAPWKPYLLDVAFQKYVISQAFPKFALRAFLMLADKTTLCPTDGLNQKFRLVSDGKGRKRAELATPLTDQELARQILRRVNVDAACSIIEKEAMSEAVGPNDFFQRIHWLADHYEKDVSVQSKPSTICAGCEFRTTAEDEARGLKSGFKECWKRELNWKDKDFDTPTVLDIWSFRKKAKLMAENRIKMAAVVREDIGPAADGKPGISPSQRQWLQVEKVKNQDASIWIDKPGLGAAMKKWHFPLHFIDFETTRTAIPFNRDRHPYELVAFQFSHHVIHEGGRIEHKSQYLNTECGSFPNYDFVRALRNELKEDEGSVFRYALHENSTLVAIYQQLVRDPSPPSDKPKLVQFIKSITTSTKEDDPWNGRRTMIDMWDLVKRYYYAPSTNGSNSIKDVLPAVLNSSTFLQKKYAAPIYGASKGIPSLNFCDKVWIQMDNGQVVDPYKQLPKMFKDISDHDFDRLSEEDELNNGGAAMTAYARMQFEEMDSEERKEIEAALLRYCELDTLAMVMIYEAWKDLIP